MDLPAKRLEQLARLLSEEERERITRVRSAKLRRRFVAARGLLRELLGTCLGELPQSLHFTYGRQGKPGLEPPATLCFNLSHSDDLALYAMALGRPLGVDLERVRTDRDVLALARRFFAPRELGQLSALAAVERARAFTQAWVCKEAYLKATGTGIWAGGLATCEVSLLPGVPVAFSCPPEAATRWTLRILDAGAELAAAVVAEGQGVTLCCFDYRCAGATIPLR